MYTLALALWIIDIRNTVTEPRLTLLSTSTEALGDRYSAAISNILRLAAVEDLLYNYMVGRQLFIECCSEQSLVDHHRRWCHYLEGICVLVEPKGKAGTTDTSLIFAWINL